MKFNRIIAGLGVVAGLCVALAPVATFAETVPAGSDTVNIQVNSDCAIKTGTTSFTGTFAGSGVPGDTVDAAISSGTSSVTFACSENSKVTVSASTTGLASGEDTIAADHLAVKLTGDGDMVARTAFTGSNYGALATTEQIVADGTAPAGGEMVLTVDGYQATLKPNQKPGAYTGTVAYTYTLVNN